jgi:hypothetical protein
MEIFDSSRALRAERLKDFGRVAFSLAAGRGPDAIDVARSVYGSSGANLVRGAMLTYAQHDSLATKGAVDTSLLNDAAFDEFGAVANAFVTAIADEFIGSKIGARKVSFAGRAMVSAIAASASWAGNGRSKPVTRSSFAGLTVPPAKVEATVVVPNDAFRSARADLEGSLVDDLRSAVARRLNATFASAAAATTDAPAGIAAGAYGVTSSGATTAAIITDVASMIDAADGFDSSLSESAFIASPKAYARLRLDRIASDDGTLAGRPLLSARGAQGLMLVDGSRVALAMDDRVAIARSEAALIEMSDDPEADSGTAVSLFQKNLVALRAELFCNWTTFGGGEGTSASPAVVSLESASWT